MSVLLPCIVNICLLAGGFSLIWLGADEDRSPPTRTIGCFGGASLLLLLFTLHLSPAWLFHAVGLQPDFSPSAISREGWLTIHTHPGVATR